MSRVRTAARATPRRVARAEGPGTAAVLLTACLAVVTTAGAGLTLVLPGVLLGEDVMNGSARGTSLVLLVAVPALLLAAGAGRRGVVQAVPVWLGTTFFVVYNAVMLLFGTPFNPLFLLYVGMLALGLGTVWAVLRHPDADLLAARLAGAPRRGVAVYVVVVVGLNALVWLRGVVVGMATPTAPPFLAGTGLPTSPLYVQDLAVWLPLAAVAAVWLWRGETLGYLLSAAVLVLWFAESLAVICDQLFGFLADPTTVQASLTGAAVFLGVAVVGLVALLVLLSPPAPTPAGSLSRARDASTPSTRRAARPPARSTTRPGPGRTSSFPG